LAFASAAEDLAGAEAAKATAPLTNPQLIKNLKLHVDDNNTFLIYTKSGGNYPNSTNIITVAIPDGSGYTLRSRNQTIASGVSQFNLLDGANYWSKGSLHADIKDAYVYAIWGGGGIVWALGGYPGFTRVPASTTATDADFFLLELNSTYTKVITDYCICVGRIRYEYDTADNPDHTIQTSVIDAPQVGWNLYPVASPKITGFSLEGGTTPKKVVVTADTSLDEAVAMSDKATIIIGTWTPVLKFGTTAQTVQTHSCKYSRIGNRVFISGAIQWAATSGSGAVSIEGLPYASADGNTAILLAGCAAGKITATGSLFYNLDSGTSILHLATQAGDVTDANMVAGVITVMGQYVAN